jgi:YebC/PmpR family DNA-binding regulatory protein
MSGHSKWSTIKHKKGAADVKRGKLFSKLSRAIIVAAKEGGPDVDGNLALQNAVEKARSFSMPKDNIERAIARGAGTDSDASSFDHVVYEGYAAAGVAVLVTTLTDNRNRTASEVRHIFDRNGGNLGTDGSVAWLFERRGVVLVPVEDVDEDELLLAAAETSMLPKTTVAVEDETDAKKVLRLMDALEDNDDVQDVYANFDIPEHVLELVAG